MYMWRAEPLPARAWRRCRPAAARSARGRVLSPDATSSALGSRSRRRAGRGPASAAGSKGEGTAAAQGIGGNTARAEYADQRAENESPGSRTVTPPRRAETGHCSAWPPEVPDRQGISGGRSGATGGKASRSVADTVEGAFLRGACEAGRDDRGEQLQAGRGGRAH